MSSNINSQSGNSPSQIPPNHHVHGTGQSHQAEEQEQSNSAAVQTPPTTQTAAPAPTDTTSPFKYNDPNANAIFNCTESLIDGLGALNTYLGIFSRTILQSDLHKDQVYADELGGMKFKSGTTPSVTNYNRNIQMEQQTLQSQMKAHQNIESMDIQNASGITSDQQQLSSMISQLLGAVSAISQSIQSMSK